MRCLFICLFLHFQLLTKHLLFLQYLTLNVLYFFIFTLAFILIRANYCIFNYGSNDYAFEAVSYTSFMSAVFIISI